MTIHKNNLDITLTNEVKATITSNMDALGESLDFLSAVLPNDGRRLYRMGICGKRCSRCSSGSARCCVSSLTRTPWRAAT